MKTFLKAQVSSFAGSVVDYTTMVLLTELAGVFYSYSIIISGIVGAFVNFYVSRNWAFGANKTELEYKQVMRFACMVLGSVLLKSYGTHFFTTLSGIDYKITRLMVDLVVAFGFNFPLQKYWIFAAPQQASEVQAK